MLLTKQAFDEKHTQMWHLTHDIALIAASEQR